MIADGTALIFTASPHIRLNYNSLKRLHDVGILSRVLLLHPVGGAYAK